MIKVNKKTSQNNELVIQHNHLIEAKYSISLQEKRLILLMSSRIQKNDKDFQTYTFSVQEICSLLQINNKNIYREIDNVISKLFTRVLVIKDLVEDSTTKISWLTHAKYWHGKGLVQLNFNQKLKPYFLEIQEKFTKISIGEVIGLKSIYAIRFFELLKQYESLGTRNFTLYEIRDYCGIPENQYLLYANLKSKVLEIAKREINSKTNISIEYEEIKTSRKVTSLKFIIKSNTEHQNSLSNCKLDKEYRTYSIILESLTEYGFSKLTAKRLIKNHGEEVVRNAIRAVNLQIERGKVKNPKAMLQIAAQEKWHPEIFKQKKKS